IRPRFLRTSRRGLQGVAKLQPVREGFLVRADRSSASRPLAPFGPPEGRARQASDSVSRWTCAMSLNLGAYLAQRFRRGFWNFLLRENPLATREGTRHGICASALDACR